MVDKTHSNHNPEKIVEFESLLDSVLADENRIWGKKNKPRDQEPSMFDLLKWQEDEPNIHDFKSNNRSLLKSSDIVKYKQQINRSNNNWKTESQDAFRKFIYSPTKKTVLFQEMESELKDKLIVSKQVRPASAEGDHKKFVSSHQHDAIICQDGEIIPEEIYYQNLDAKFTSENLDKYSLKKILNEEDLKRELAENAQSHQNYKDKFQSKLYLSHSNSDGKNKNKKLVAKKLQVKPFVYDRSGNLIGKPEDYYNDVWCEVDETSKSPKIYKSDGEEENSNYSENEEKKVRDNIKSRKKKEDDDEDNIYIKKEDYSGVKSKLYTTKTIKKAKVLDPVLEKDKLDRRKQRIKLFSEQTKWLPNSAFTTYFGKPPFENYGRANTRPASGGVLYGNYMKTHNVNPHRGKRTPDYKQSYNNALMYGSRMPPCEPELPRKVKEDYRLSQKEVINLKSRNPLSPEKSFKDNFEGQKIIKPDLVNSLRFASEENTPTNSPTMRGMGKASLSNLQKEQKAIRKKLASKSAQKSKKNDFSKFQSQKGNTDLIQTHNLNEKQPSRKISEKKKEIHGDEPYVSKKIDFKENNLHPNANKQEILHSEKANNLLYSEPPQQYPPALKKKLSKKEKARELELLENDEKVYPEHEAKVNKKFIKSMKEKKEYANRLAPKVTQVIPVIQTVVEKKSKIKDQESPPEKTMHVDEMNPPKGYISNLTPNELNPKFYKHVPAVWLKRIPYAGKYIHKDGEIKESIQPV